jgi:hypothetical protein
MDAARILRVVGSGHVRAGFAKALHLQVPDGLVVRPTAPELGFWSCGAGESERFRHMIKGLVRIVNSEVG